MCPNDPQPGDYWDNVWAPMGHQTEMKFKDFYSAIIDYLNTIIICNCFEINQPRNQTPVLMICQTTCINSLTESCSHFNN